MTVSTFASGRTGALRSGSRTGAGRGRSSGAWSGCPLSRRACKSGTRWVVPALLERVVAEDEKRRPCPHPAVWEGDKRLSFFCMMSSKAPASSAVLAAPLDLAALLVLGEIALVHGVGVAHQSGRRRPRSTRAMCPCRSRRLCNATSAFEFKAPAYSSSNIWAYRPPWTSGS